MRTQIVLAKFPC